MSVVTREDKKLISKRKHDDNLKVKFRIKEKKMRSLSQTMKGEIS